MEYEVPIWEKSYLTLGEASAYTGIGERKLRELCSREDCEFILWVGEKKYINRRRLDEYLDSKYSI